MEILLVIANDFGRSFGAFPKQGSGVSCGECTCAKPGFFIKANRDVIAGTAGSR
jgi:hypothetical protein